MTRQKQIKQQAKLLCNTVSPEEYFIMGAEWADRHPQNRWISVEDELPPKESEYDDNSIVVLATDGNDVYKGIYRSDEYLSGWFTHDLWALDNITYWMPLPSVEHLKKGDKNE